MMQQTQAETSNPSILQRMPTDIRCLILNFGPRHSDRFKSVLRDIRIKPHDHKVCGNCQKYECLTCKWHPDGEGHRAVVDKCGRCLRFLCLDCIKNHPNMLTNRHSSPWFYCTYCRMSVCANCFHACNCKFQFFDGSCTCCVRSDGGYFEPCENNKRPFELDDDYEEELTTIVKRRRL